jgi:hypothetical protein
MESLETLRKARESAVGEAEKALKKESRRILRASQREKRKLESEYERRLNTVKSRHEREISSIENLAKRERDLVDNYYYAQASEVVLAGLNQDNKYMNFRDQLAKFSQEVLYRAQQTKKALEATDNLEDIAEKETIRTALESSINPELREAIDIISTDRPEKTAIDFYLSSNTKGVYILVPTKSPQSSGVEKTLEDFVTEIVSLGTAPNGLSKKSLSPGIVTSTETEIRFYPELDEIGGFSLYSLKPRDQKDTSLLTKAIKAKLVSLQPRELKDSGLSVKFVDIESEVIDYLRNPGESSTDRPTSRQAQQISFLDYNSAAKVLGYTVRGVKSLVTKGILEGDSEGVDIGSVEAWKKKKEDSRRLPDEPRRSYFNKNPFDPYEAREKTYAYLSQCGEQVTFSDIKEMFYTTTRTGTRDLVRKIAGRPVSSDETIAKSDVQKYLEGREPTRLGWRPKKR